MGWNERSDPDMRTANFCDVYREGVYINNDLFWSIGSFVWFTKMICKQITFEYSVKGAVGDLVKW